MAVEKCKLAFLALAFVCLLQNAVAAPSPLAGSDNFAPPPELEIVGRAFAEIAKSFSEFVKSLATIVTSAVTEGIVKVGLPIYLKAHLIFTASGVQDSSLTFTTEEQFEYRVLAATIERLRQKLDVVDRFEPVFESILSDAALAFLASPGKDASPGAVLTRLISTFNDLADKRLRQHPELKEVFQHIRQKVRAEEANVPPFIVNFAKWQGDGQGLVKVLPEEVKTKVLIILVNKQFLHNSRNRITVIKKEYFLLARSTLELAKKRNKAELVQKVYDKSLSQVSLYLDPIRADIFDMSKGIFQELKSNFEANPQLNQEWRETQKYVSQSHEWDSGIWDLDLVPF